MHNNNILRGKEILYLFMKIVIFFLIRFLNWRQCLRHKSTLKSVKSANEKNDTGKM